MNQLAIPLTANKIPIDDDPSILTDIYQMGTNIAVWRRALPPHLCGYANLVAHTHRTLQMRLVNFPDGISKQLRSTLPDSDVKVAFISDIELVMAMFCELFGLNEIGLRLAVLTRAMCPKFHVDYVPCRLVTTYCGQGTEWLENDNVVRDKNDDVEVAELLNVHSLQVGDIALLKGEAWEGNEHNGLVHRSPAASITSPRLVLTLDFA